MIWGSDVSPVPTPGGCRVSEDSSARGTCPPGTGAQTGDHRRGSRGPAASGTSPVGAATGASSSTEVPTVEATPGLRLRRGLGPDLSYAPSTLFEARTGRSPTLSAKGDTEGAFGRGASETELRSGGKAEGRRSRDGTLEELAAAAGPAASRRLYGPTRVTDDVAACLRPPVPTNTPPPPVAPLARSALARRSLARSRARVAPPRSISGGGRRFESRVRKKGGSGRKRARARHQRSR